MKTTAKSSKAIETDFKINSNIIEKVTQVKEELSLEGHKSLLFQMYAVEEEDLYF
ncbi:MULTISPECIES: hypothetical protein [unclassified Flavobacterium]|jgi:hypothetical protein|uniref:hypothetical protein n=1 Tax=unclassified Flavobacterium TaxID=196869 RepID=UPI000B33AB64|nr:hypothetical protein [Flavobacterium sp. ABG]